MSWLDMGHHTFYVWLAYGVSIGALVAIVATSLSKKKNALIRLVKLERRAQQERMNAKQSD